MSDGHLFSAWVVYASLDYLDLVHQISNDRSSVFMVEINSTKERSSGGDICTDCIISVKFCTYRCR